jgi:hypothetical protein
MLLRIGTKSPLAKVKAASRMKKWAVPKRKGVLGLTARSTLRIRIGHERLMLASRSTGDISSLESSHFSEVGTKISGTKG